MAKKCIVPHCTTNYRKKKKSQINKEKTPVYRLPADPEECVTWMKSLPFKNLETSKHSVICQKHWPASFKTVSKKGKLRPSEPPSVWPGVPRSCVPTPTAPLRPTKRSSLAIRGSQPDEMDQFLQEDKVVFGNIVDRVATKPDLFHCSTIAYTNDSRVYIQSTSFSEGVPRFVIEVTETLEFKCFHLGINVTVPCIVKNRISFLKSWSAIVAAVNYLHSHEPVHKVQVIHQQLQSMSTKRKHTKLYSPKVIVRAFCYFATSRASYRQLRMDFQFPSESTLGRITSTFSKQDNNDLTKNIFNTLNEKQKVCVLLHDEIYIKKMLQFHGGQIFGKAINDSKLMAETMLGIMINCLHGGPKFITKMLPVAKLNTQFLFQQVIQSVKSIENASGKVKVIICDGNRTNQSFFKNFETVPGSPWLTTEGIYLLYDYVHLIKNIRNLWITEKCSELEFRDENDVLIAKWQHLRNLHKYEAGSLLKMSKLDEVSVYPKPIERQRVSTCLNVFCEKTATALELYGEQFDEDVKGTVIFLRKVIKCWTIINVKNKGIDVRNRQPLQAVMSDPNDERLSYIQQFGEMCLKMAGRQGNRIRQLSKDTAAAIHHTCFGLVDLTRHLLTEESYDYVCLAEFSTDRLEKSFGKLRQGSGGAYFINAQQITEKLRINHAKLQLKLNCDYNITSESIKHQCADCNYSMDEAAFTVFDTLPELEEHVEEEMKLNLFHIAGFVIRKIDIEDQNEDTYYYREKYGTYTESLNRGGLVFPRDTVCQWAVFCFIIFEVIKNNVCRTSLMQVFQQISDHYGFIMQKCHCKTLANIFMNNFCKISTPILRKESKQKVIKLS